MARSAILFFILLCLARLAMGQIPAEALRGPMCGMVDPDTRQSVAVSPAFTQVNVVVTDAIAQAVVTQTFVNPFRAASEAMYLFPLPEQGSVHGMQYTYRESLYVAEIMERARAEAKYDSIKKEGGQAALLLQDRPNLFQQKLATLAPGETARVEIRLSFALKYVDGELELAFPTHIGPRYPAGPGVPGGWNPPEDRAGPGFQFNVLVQSGVALSAITSPSHPLEVGELSALRRTLAERGVIAEGDRPAGEFVRGVVLKTQSTYPNRDYVLRLKRAAGGQEFSVASHVEPGASSRAGGYFLLNLYPDPALFTGPRPDLDVVLLVDVSGSQAGWPLEREKEIALDILGRLTDRDVLNVLSFSDAVKYAFAGETPVPATRASIAAAEAFVRGLATEGGTQLLQAVKTCLAVPTREGKKRIYIFLTDGFITDEASILAAIREHPSRPTVYTFGAGNNLNRHFLEEAAKVGDGFATPVTQGDATGALVDAAWKRIEAPQLENIQVDFGGLALTDVIHPVSRRLYRGLPYQVMGRYARGGTHTVTLHADRDGRPVSFPKSVTLAGEATPSWAVPKLWARERMGQLMLEQGATERNRPAIIALSLEYQVLSAYTAFLAAAPKPTGGGAVSLEAAVARPGDATFALALRGGMLHLEWKGGARVKSIRVLDPRGRVVFAWRPREAALLSRWAWDGRDAHGRALGRGRYLVSVETSGGVRTRAFAWNPATVF